MCQIDTIPPMRIRSWVHRIYNKEKNRVRPAGRTLPKFTYDSDMYNRAFPIGNALFFFAWDMMSLFRLP